MLNGPTDLSCVTHSLEALDEGSGTEMRTEGHRRHFSLVEECPPSFFFYYMIFTHSHL